MTILHKLYPHESHSTFCPIRVLTMNVMSIGTLDNLLPVPHSPDLAVIRPV